MESAIGQLTSGDVYKAVALALRRGRDMAFMSRFLSSLDWAAISNDESPFADTLLDLLNWTTMAEEGELSEEQYATKLMRVLPTGGPITYTVIRLAPVGGPVVLAQPSLPPQTGSESEADPETLSLQRGSDQVLARTR